MAQLNPMLVRLQQKIENYNKDVQRKIDDVANRQKLVTIGVIVFNLVVLFLTNYLLPDDSKDESLRLLSFFSNDQLSILITVISIGFSLSTATLIGKNSFKKMPQVNWQSNPIAYDEHKVSWSFNGVIWWNDDKNYANEFSGIELYYVRDTDSQGRPSLLEGRLIGTILVGDKFYVVDAVSKFTRKQV